MNFYSSEDIEDSALKFVVIVSGYKNKWIYCKHKDRATWEVPGGHRETGETVDRAARRELYEETGAVEFELTPICVYSVKTTEECFGMLYYAKILELGTLPDSEIETTGLFDTIPENLTYPSIQPRLVDKVLEYNQQIF